MTCLYCFGPVVEKGRGRIPLFCCNACKQAHWRLAKNGFKRIRVSAVARSLAVPGSLSLRKAGGTGTNDSLSLRKSGTFSQVDWTS